MSGNRVHYHLPDDDQFSLDFVNLLRQREKPELIDETGVSKTEFAEMLSRIDD